MLELLVIAIGGALGAVARFSLGNLVGAYLGTGFPYGILVVNVSGCFVMGICFELLVEQNLLPGPWRSLIMVGFLGSFTTFSTFSLQVLGLFQTDKLIAALVYILSSVICSILAAAIGIFLCRQLTH